MNTKPKFTLRDLSTKAGVLRAAAEVIGHDMLTRANKDERHGCCAAFEELDDMVYDHYRKLLNKADSWTPRYYSLQNLRNKRLEVIEDAKEHFESLYKPRGATLWSFWMGKTRDDKQQERRIAALLSAAETT